MSQETLRQQLSKLKSKLPKAPAAANQPTTLTRAENKLKPRTIGSGKIKVQIGGPKAARPWTERAKEKVLVARREANSIQQINSIKSDAFMAALDAVDKEVGSIRKKALEEATVAQSRELTAVRRDAETVLNLVKTVREGNRVNDIELEHVPPLVKQMVGHLKKLYESLVALETPKVEKHEPTEQLMNEANVASFRQRYERQLKTALTEHAESPFFFIDQPVLPVFEGIVKTSVLLAAGLPVEDMAGYPVLLSQRLLVLNPDVLKSRGIDRDAYVMKLLGLLNKQSEQQFMMVMEPDQIKMRDGMVYYWLMPNNAYKSLTLATGAQTSVRDWGLAF